MAIQEENIGKAIDIRDAITKKHAHANSSTLDATQESFTTTLKDKLDGIVNPMLFKGEINIASDFPTVASVQNGWTFRIATDVTDNDASKTNTGQSFLADAEIAWDGTGWIELGYSAVKSVNGATGIVTLDEDDIGAGVTNKKYTDTEKTKLTGIATGAEVNVATNLSEGTSTETTVDVDSSDGTNATLASASTLRAGLLTKAKFDEIVANTAKVDTAISSIIFVIDGGGSAITTGIKGDIEIPFNCTIDEVTLLADQSGSIVIDVWKDTYANFPATDADSITASAVPTITTAVKSQDGTLTGWTTSVSAGDILRFNVDSITTVERVTITLKVTRT